MTVSSQNNVVYYTGNGIVKEFAVPFKFFEQVNIEVYTSSESQPTTKLTLNDDYFVFGEGEENGGSVLLKKAPQAGVKVAVVRFLEMTQEIDYRENEVFPAKTHEQALDRLTMITQQNSEKISRCLSLGIMSEEDPDQILPSIFDAQAICIGKVLEAEERVLIATNQASIAVTEAERATAEANRSKAEADSIKSNVILSAEIRKMILLAQWQYDSLPAAEKNNPAYLYFIRG